MRMKTSTRLRNAVRWVGRILDVRLPMGTIAGIRTR